MAAITTAAVAAGAAIYSANKQAGAAKAAGNKASRAADAAAAATEQNYQRTQTNLQPYLDAGTDALTKINAVNSGDYTGFQNSPDYLFARDQGIQAQDRSAAARGSLYSGGHSADLATFASGLASQNLNTYYNRLTGLASQGQGAATNLGSIGNGAAAQAGNFNLAGANAQGQSLYDQSNSNTNLVNNLTGIAGQFAGQYGSRTAANASSYGTPSAINNAGLLGGASYTGPGSTMSYIRSA
jgi:hypothetical protein